MGGTRDRGIEETTSGEPTMYGDTDKGPRGTTRDNPEESQREGDRRDRHRRTQRERERETVQSDDGTAGFVVGWATGPSPNPPRWPFVLPRRSRDGLEREQATEARAVIGEGWATMDRPRPLCVRPIHVPCRGPVPELVPCGIQYQRRKGRGRTRVGTAAGVSLHQAELAELAQLAQLAEACCRACRWRKLSCATWLALRAGRSWRSLQRLQPRTKPKTTGGRGGIGSHRPASQTADVACVGHTVLHRNALLTGIGCNIKISHLHLSAWDGRVMRVALQGGPEHLRYVGYIPRYTQVRSGYGIGMRGITERD